MNREQRRRAARRRRTERFIRTYADSYECPDCNADTRLEHLAPGVHRLKVMHDETCPTYAAMTKGRRQ